MNVRVIKPHLVFLLLALISMLKLSAQKQSQPNIDQLVNQLETARPDTNKVNLLDKIATGYQYNDWQKMLLYGNKELELAEKLGWIKGQVTAYCSLGTAYEESNELQKALQCYERGDELARKNGLLMLQNKIVVRMGYVHFAMKNYDRAFLNFTHSMEYYQQSVPYETSPSLGDKPLWYYPAFTAGVICDRQKKGVSAANFYQGILDNYLRKNDSFGIRNALDFLVVYHTYYKLNYSEALEYAFRELTYFKESDTTNAHAFLFILIAYMYGEQKNYVKALEYYRFSMSLKPVADDEIKGPATTGMVGTYRILGDYSNALKLQLDELKDDTGRNKIDNTSMALTYQEISKDYIHLKQNEQALLYINKALSLSDRSGDPRTKASLLGFLAYIYYQEKRYDDALITLKASSSFKKLQEYQEVQKSFNAVCLGLIIRDAPANLLQKYDIPPGKRNQLAVKNLRLALRFLDIVNLPIERQECYKELSVAYEKMGDYVKFHDTYKHYIALRDSSVNRENQNVFISRLAEMQFEKKEDSLKYQQVLTNEKLRQQTVLTLQQKKYYISGILALLALSFFITRNYLNQRKANRVITTEKNRSDDLLLNILPADVAEELKEKGSADAKLFEEVTVLFTDFVNFTSISELLTPQQLVDELHYCFKTFDDIISKYNIEKIKTIGDAYLAVAGLPNADPHHALNTVKAALEIRQFIHNRNESMGNKTFNIRIGIHSGSVVAGIVGVKKFAYDIWGDTVNTAARMEQHSMPGKINLSEKTYALVKDQFAFVYRGEIEAKNKGALKMYFIEEQTELLQNAVDE